MMENRYLCKVLRVKQRNAYERAQNVVHCLVDARDIKFDCFLVAVTYSSDFFLLAIFVSNVFPKSFYVLKPLNGIGRYFSQMNYRYQLKACYKTSRCGVSGICAKGDLSCIQLLQYPKVLFVRMRTLPVHRDGNLGDLGVNGKPLSSARRTISFDFRFCFVFGYYEVMNVF